MKTISSMTAFARKEQQDASGDIVCELRSVNHRYLDFTVRLPDAFRSLEPVLRDIAKKRLARGKVECFFRYRAGQQVKNELAINQSLAMQLINAAKDVAAASNLAQIETMQIMQWPGVVSVVETKDESIQQACLAVFDETVTALLKARSTEGGALSELISHRLTAIEKHLSDLTTRLPTVLASQRQRLLTRFEEAKIELEPTRLEQELLLLAQKIDVAEEMDRLQTHITEMRRVLAKGGAVGRRLDFLLQEFNREANTLASKSIDSEVTHIAVDLKVLIEQMREQVQNIE